MWYLVFDYSKNIQYVFMNVTYSLVNFPLRTK